MAILITIAEQTRLFSILVEASKNVSNFEISGEIKQQILDGACEVLGKSKEEVYMVWNTAATMFEDMEQLKARIARGEIVGLRAKDNVCGFETCEGSGQNGWYEVYKHPNPDVRRLVYLENSTFAWWNEFADISEALDNHRHSLPATLYSRFGPRVSHIISFTPPAPAPTASAPAPAASQSPYPPLPGPTPPAPARPIVFSFPMIAAPAALPPDLSAPILPAPASRAPPALSTSTSSSPVPKRSRTSLGRTGFHLTANLPVHAVRSSYALMVAYHHYRIVTSPPLTEDRSRPDGTLSTRIFNTPSERYPEWPLARELDNVILDSRSSPTGRWQCPVVGCKYGASGAPCKTKDSLYRHFRTQHLADKKAGKILDLGRGTLVAVSEQADTEFRGRPWWGGGALYDAGYVEDEGEEEGGEEGGA